MTGTKRVAVGAAAAGVVPALTGASGGAPVDFARN
jgi:hypothetical protein